MRWSAKSKLEKRRVEALSSITGELVRIELMAQRPRLDDDPLDTVLFEKLSQAIREIEARAKQAATISELDDLTEDAEMQGQSAAYLCPAAEIPHEGEMIIDLIDGWGVPKTATKRLRELLSKRLRDEPRIARGALRMLFEERDAWGEYTDDYEDIMQRYAWWLFAAAVTLPPLAAVGFHFASVFSPLLLFVGLLFAGAAGSCVSVIGKMPALDVSLAGELEAYRRRIFSRVGIGVVASLIGAALSSWLPVSIQNQTFGDAVKACTAGAATCSGTNALLLLGLPMLLGFSERTLASFEQRMFGGSNKSQKG